MQEDTVAWQICIYYGNLIDDINESCRYHDIRLICRAVETVIKRSREKMLLDLKNDKSCQEQVL